MLSFVFLQVVEEPYTMREARIHVRHVRDLLKSLDPADAYNGVDCSSLSFLNVVTQGDILGISNYSVSYQLHSSSI
jgi:protein TIF31